MESPGKDMEQIGQNMESPGKDIEHPNKDVKHEAHMSSEEWVTHLCEALCRKKGKISQAVAFCPVCPSLFCEPCLEFHTALHEAHKTVPVSEDDVPPRTEKQELTETCEEHGKVIKLYCGNHDQVMCRVCAVLYHRLCKRVEYVVNIGKDIDISGMTSELSAILDHLEVSVDIGTNTIRRHQESRQDCLNQNNNDTEFLVNQVHALGERTAEVINRRYDKLEGKMSATMSTYNRLKDRIKATLQKINQGQNKHALFVAQKLLPDVKVKINDLDKKKAKLTSKAGRFLKDESIEQILASYPALGYFDELDSGRAYKIVKMTELSVKMTTDGFACDIEGSCLMQDGSLLLTDRNNCKLKRFDPMTYTVSDVTSLSGSPRGICTVEEDGIAICLVNKKVILAKIQDGAFYEKKSLVVNHFCYGVIYHNKTLFVSDKGQHVFVYNMIGNLLRIITASDTGQPLFVKTRHLAISQQGDRLYVADSHRGVVITDRSGNLVHSYEGPGLQTCLSLCSDGRSSVFAVGWASNTVIQLASDGQFITEILNKKQCSYPQTVCFDKTKGKLYVTSNSNVLTVIDLTK